MFKFKSIEKWFGIAFIMSFLLVTSFITSAYASEWATVYGGAQMDVAYSVQHTADGGYVVAGRTESFGAGSGDILILKLDSSGNAVWQKTYGGAQMEIAFSVQQTADGGYIVAGYTESFGAGSGDILILKLDSSGNAVWQKTYGGSHLDVAFSIQQTADGGYIVAGYTSSSLSAESEDILILKLDSSGNAVWQKKYGGTKLDVAYFVRQTADGGYVVAGRTESFGAGLSDSWILKLDSNGNAVWQRTYGGQNEEVVDSIQQTADGGYIVTGYTQSFGAGSGDILILKLDSSGNAVWQKTYGGSKLDEAYSIQQTADGGYVVAGSTQSFGAGSGDIWILKLESSGNALWQKTYGSSQFDHANSIQQTADGGYIVTGYTQSFGAGSGDIWILKLDSSGGINGCSIIGGNTTNATIINTNANSSSPSVTGSNTSVTVQSTSVSGSVPTLTNTTQCEAIGFDLSISKNGSGSGTVTSTPTGINCGSDCSESYTVSTQVTLTATPTAGSTFAGWSGDSDCSDGMVTMTADKTCTATFNIGSNYALTITKSGTGSGTVTSTPSGINCGSDCSENYSNDTQVTLVALTDTGSIFGGWGGDSDCSDGLVTMTTNKTCSATFNILTYLLTITKNGTGTGTVTSSPAGINCGNDCSESYSNSTQVALTASAGADSTFAGWNGDEDCSDGTVTMAATRVCTATFNVSHYTLTVIKTGSCCGTVTSSPGGIDCGSDCSEIYNTNAQVTLEAESCIGAVFAGWTGCSSTNGTTCIVEMDGNKTVTANFIPLSPVYRFWGDVSHFYSISDIDKDYVIATWPNFWHYEGLAFYAHQNQAFGTLPVYRFWSGRSHFYTISEADKAYVIATWPNIWHYEGIAFYANPTQVPGTLPVYRFWGGESHFYTISEEEKNYVIATWPNIWHYEGIAYYAFPDE